MGVISSSVRPLSYYDDDATSTTSAVVDIQDSVEVHALLKVSAVAGTSPSLAVKAQHSIDGETWEDLAGMGFTGASDVAAETVSATENAYRYLRFLYTLTGTTPSATFSVDLFVKTRS